MRLRSLLGTAEPILWLWCWAAENATNGDLSGFSVAEIEDAAGWKGTEGKAFKALCDAGFIDVSDDVSHNKMTLHEWQDTAGAKISAYLRRKEQQKLLMRARRSGSGSEDPDQREEKEIRDKSNSNLLLLTSEQPKRAKRKAGEASEGFLKFWEAYPRKTAKGQALKAWPGDGLAEKILAALSWQVPTWGEIQYVKHPATWLNARCWEDEKPTASSTAQRQPQQASLRIGHTRAEDFDHSQIGEIKL